MKKKTGMTTLGFIIIFTLMALTAVGWAKDIPVTEEGAHIKVAALLPLSGDLASKGDMRQAALELAVDDVNEKWVEQGKPYRMELIIRDSGSDPDKAFTEAEQLWGDGVRIFIVGSSAEVQRLKPWADVHGALIISYSSTAPSLASEGDSVFRMVPNDVHQARALADLFVEGQIYGVVPVFRDDVYGWELFQHLMQEFEVVFGRVSEPVVYDLDENDWDEVIGRISDELGRLGLLDEHKAVVMFSFDEANELLARSERLGNIRWYGGDTVTLSPAILSDAEVARRAEAVRLTGVTFGLPDNSFAPIIAEKLGSQVKQDLIPDSLFAYDIPGMLAAAIERLDRPHDPVELRTKLVELSSFHHGATGWTLLDEYGDRKYYQYDIWNVQTSSDVEDSYEWKLVMHYSRVPGGPGFLYPVDHEDTSMNESTIWLGFEMGETDFGRAVSREEFTYMLMHALGQPAQEAMQQPTFHDAAEIDDRAIGPVQIASEKGVITGYPDNTFRPKATITMAEALAMVDRALEADENSVGGIESKVFVKAPEWAVVHITNSINLGVYVPKGDSVIDGDEPLLLGDASMIVLNILQRGLSVL